MALCAHDDFITATGLRHNAQLIAHRTAGDKHRSLFTQNTGSLGLQQIGGGVILIYVIAHSSLPHGLTHGLGGLGHSIASQVNIAFFFHHGSLRILFHIPAERSSFPAGFLIYSL